MQRMLKQNYQDDIKDGFYKEGQFINKAPKEEKPSFIAQTKNLAGSVFNAITGTQTASASQIPGGMPTGETQFSSKNLDAAKATTGDTSLHHIVWQVNLVKTNRHSNNNQRSYSI